MSDRILNYITCVPGGVEEVANVEFATPFPRVGRLRNRKGEVPSINPDADSSRSIPSPYEVIALQSGFFLDHDGEA